MPTPMSWMPILALQLQFSTATLSPPAVIAPVQPPHPIVRVDTVPASRRHSLRTAAVIGAVVGGIAGYFVSRDFTLDCLAANPGDCTYRPATTLRVGVTLSGVALGAGAGALLAAILNQKRIDPPASGR